MISTKRVIGMSPFQQWGLDFIGEINPNLSRQHKWNLIATDYFTKWIEAIPTWRATETVIMDFLEENILPRFGCPKRIVTDNETAFKSKKMIDLYHKYHISLNHSTAYYPQGNGLAESSNKSLVRIIKKLLEDNKKSWHTKSNMLYVPTGLVPKGQFACLRSNWCMELKLFFQHR